MFKLLPGAPAASVFEATAPVNLWHGPVRSGKTISSLIRWIEFVKLAPKNGELFMIGVTEDTLERNILKPLEALCKLAGIRFSYSRGSHTFTLGGRVGWILGASNKAAEAKIRGATAAGIYGDELSLWPIEVLNQCFMRLSVVGAMMFGTTNPGGPYHPLKTEYIDRSLELGYRVFHWDIDQNTALDPAYIQRIKKQFVGLWYKRFVQGLWVAAEGAVYDNWDEDRHVIEAEPGEASHYVCGVDYGTSNATAAVLMGVNATLRPKVWAKSEYYHSGRDSGRTKTDGQYADELLSWLEAQGVLKTKLNIAEAHQDVDSDCVRGGYLTGKHGRLECVILDPSAASFRAELLRRGLPVMDAVNDVVDGIRTQANMLETGLYKIHVDCYQTIKDYSAYLWDSKAQARGEDKPLKQHDHTKDAERYPLHTLFGAQANFFIGSA